MACESPRVQRTTVGGPESNTPLHPLEANNEGLVKTCWNDEECTVMGSFTHCVKDRPEDIGYCTRACGQQRECTSRAAWSCEVGVWTTEPLKTKQMCMLYCSLDSACPRGLSCNNGFCGTPCHGLNCDCGPAERQCDADGNVIIVDGCGTKAAETCGSGHACQGGFCR